MRNHPGDENDGMPHVFAVFTGPGSQLPSGLIECGVCGGRKTHREIRAWDADLAQYLCRHCFLPMSQAEYWLRQTPGVRMPAAVEASALEARESGIGATDGTDTGTDERRAA